jgi:predicted phosphohydrolase
MRLAWVTDPHLNFASLRQRREFYASVNATGAAAAMVSGDWDEAEELEARLAEWALHVVLPTYFVLGNHDFYQGSIEAVRRGIPAVRGSMRYLTKSGLVTLEDGVALIGHDGWADGRNGDYPGSPVQLADYFLIQELRGLSKAALWERLQALGDEAANYLEQQLRAALRTHHKVLLLTHVPPYREACWHEGRLSDDNWQPHFSCRAVGERLTTVMQEHPRAELTVYCGHTHGDGIARILPNLTVHTGGAVYGEPRVWAVIDTALSGAELAR